MAHFYETLPEAIAGLSDREAVVRYAAGAEVPARRIAGLGEAQLDAHPVPGTWSARELVCHLMDTDLIASYRMKRIIAEERPRLDLYDENAFVARLGYDRLEAAGVCELFKLNRLVTAEILRGLPDETFSRVALHEEMGEMSLSRFVRLYIMHLDHHMRFLTEKRMALGRPAW